MSMVQYYLVIGNIYLAVSFLITVDSYRSIAFILGFMWVAVAAVSAWSGRMDAKKIPLELKAK